MMLIKIIVAGILACMFCLDVSAQYKITVSIDGYQNDTCILGYQVGGTTYVSNAVYERNQKGAFVFEGETTLLGGLYSVLIKPDNKYFQFIISSDEAQKDLILRTKITDNPAVELTANLKVENSKDNEVFMAFKSFLGQMRQKSQSLSRRRSSAEAQNDTALIRQLSAKFLALDQEVASYQDQLLLDYPDLLSPKIINGSRPPVVPDTIKDRAAVFNYYKAHFWDNFDWSDARLIRTPILKQKMDTYLEKLTMQTLDSVAAACVYMIDQALKYKSKEMFQYVAVQLLNQYAKQEVICMDGVYVTIAQKYYCSGLAYWLDSAKTASICADAQRMAPLRCGKNAPEARLKNINDSSYVSLYSIRKPFVAVYFWDPTCGNCAKMSKKLVPVYNKWKDKGFEIYGVCSKPWKEVEMCRKKVEDASIEWLNTTDDPYPLAWVKKYYDLRSNPYLYLLNEDKEIIYKRLSADQLDGILEREFNRLEQLKNKNK